MNCNVTNASHLERQFHHDNEMVRHGMRNINCPIHQEPAPHFDACYTAALIILCDEVDEVEATNARQSRASQTRLPTE